MEKQQLIDELESMRDQLDNLDGGGGGGGGGGDEEDEAEEVEAPESEFHVGDILDIASVNKDGEMEFLTGTVIEIQCSDEHGFYDRIQTPDGRKFRIPMNSVDTRLGTRVMRVHDR